MKFIFRLKLFLDEDEVDEIDEPEEIEPSEAKMSTPDSYKRLLSKSDRRSSAHNTPLQKVLIERMVIYSMTHIYDSYPI